MLFSNFLPILTLSLAAITVAAPAPFTTTAEIDNIDISNLVPANYANLTLTPRDAPLGLYICKGPFWNGPFWNGPCAFHPERFTLCNNMPADWNNQASSFGPPRNYFCSLYKHWNCQGRSISLTYPGSASLAKNGFSNIGSSWRCSPANARGVLLGTKRDAEAETEAEAEWKTEVVGAPVED